jgi:hypothetical protein
MDIVDSFNFTRISWSKGYKCSYRNIDEYSILIIALTFTLATVTFYIMSRLINTKETIEFATISKFIISINLNKKLFIYLTIKILASRKSLNANTG